MQTDNIVFSEYLNKFIAHLQDKGKSRYTIVAYKKDIEQFLGYLAKVQVGAIVEVKKENIQSFIEELLTTGYTRKSASRKLNSIRTFYRFLKSESVVTVNPALDVAHPRFENNKPRILSKLEYRALRDYARNDKRTYAIIELFLQTGIRIGELANIRLSDMKSEVLVVREYGKNENREIQLNKLVKSSVEEYLTVRPQTDTEDHLFITKNKKPLLIRNIRNVVDRCFKEVGIENAKVNDLRNTFIAHQLAAGVPIAYVSKVVGHKRLSSTESFLDLVKPEQPSSSYRLDEL
ncbi:MAG: tyrosine-type recombinase/integrase [Candidatus Roizmanbacteria bacterium]|nr:tyrosine-type recombinase/integrase [Candidatus Roizmanbacteria bacterium]